MQKAVPNIAVTEASPEDAAALLAIYAPYVEKTAITFEYEVPTAEEFALRIKKTLERHPYLKATDRFGRILGYIYASPLKGRAAYAHAVETSIYVAEDQRRSGLGRLLYSKLETCLKAQHVINLYACIAYPSDDRKEDPYLTTASVRFHERLGFQKCAHFKECGFKFDRWYDIVWMEKLLGEHTEKPLPFVEFSKLKF